LTYDVSLKGASSKQLPSHLGCNSEFFALYALAFDMMLALRAHPLSDCLIYKPAKHTPKLLLAFIMLT
jgi:hypothetical protein